MNQNLSKWMLYLNEGNKISVMNECLNEENQWGYLSTYYY